MKICMVAPHLDYPKTLGGLVHQIELSKALAERGHEVHLIAQEIGPFEEEAKGIFVHKISTSIQIDDPISYAINRIVLLFKTVRLIMRLHKQYKFDLIHDRGGYNLGGAGTIAASILCLPTVFQVDDNWFEALLLHCRFLSKVGRFITKVGMSIAYFWLKKIILPQVKQIVVVSRALKSVVVERWGVPSSRVSVVPNAVNIQKFNPSLNGSEVRRRYKLDAKHIILFIGEIAPWQGLDHLLIALSQVVRREPSATAVIVGGVKGVHQKYLNYLLSITEKIGLKNHVMFTGMRPYQEIPYIISAADVAVAPFIKLEEGSLGFSPLKILEYMAVGKPIVATKVSHIEEILQDGTDALLVDFSPEEMAKAILKILRDKALSERLGASARKKAARSFTWEKIAEKLEGVYHNVIDF